MSDFNAQIIEVPRQRREGRRRLRGRRWCCSTRSAPARAPIASTPSCTAGTATTSSSSPPGAAPPPADWFHNLVAHPDVTVEVGTDVPVRARVAEGDERERLWARQKELMPGLAEYEAKTTRQIPVIVLEPDARLKKTCGGGVLGQASRWFSAVRRRWTAPVRVRGLRPRGETSPAPARSREARGEDEAAAEALALRVPSTGIRWPAMDNPRGTSTGSGRAAPGRHTRGCRHRPRSASRSARPDPRPARLPETGARRCGWCTRQWRYGEVAEAMGTSVSMVGNHVRRGLDRLLALEVDARA